MGKNALTQTTFRGMRCVLDQATTLGTLAPAVKEIRHEACDWTRI